MAGENGFRTLFKKRRDGTDSLDYAWQERSVVADASKKRTYLLKAFGHGHVGEGGDFVGVKANAGGGNGEANKMSFGGTQSGLGWGNLGSVFVGMFEPSRMVGTCSVGPASKMTTSSRYARMCSKPKVTWLMTLTNQPGVALLTCGMTQPNSCIGSQKAVSGTVSGWAVVIGGNTIPSQNNENIIPLPRESNN